MNLQECLRKLREDDAWVWGKYGPWYYQTSEYFLPYPEEPKFGEYQAIKILTWECVRILRRARRFSDIIDEIRMSAGERRIIKKELEIEVTRTLSEDIGNDELRWLKRTLRRLKEGLDRRLTEYFRVYLKGREEYMEIGDRYFWAGWRGK